jgi:hypothetical protein
MKPLLRIVLPGIFFFACCHCLAQSYIPKEGYVPDSKTAVSISEAVLIPIYGKEQITSERPFTARLEGSIWHVYGYLPPNMEGGVAEVWIDKQSGRIVRLIHQR